MNWNYEKRIDGKIAVTFDNNVFDFLLFSKIDLYSELPPLEFVIFIPREVEIEITAISDLKKELKEFAQRTVEL